MQKNINCTTIGAIYSKSALRVVHFKRIISIFAVKKHNISVFRHPFRKYTTLLPDSGEKDVLYSAHVGEVVL